MQGDFWKNGASHSKVQTVKNHAACKGQALEEEFYQKMHLTAKHTSNTKIIRVSHAFRGSSFHDLFQFQTYGSCKFMNPIIMCTFWQFQRFLNRISATTGRWSEGKIPFQFSEIIPWRKTSILSFTKIKSILRKFFSSPLNPVYVP